jgi:hypothetical protein
MVKPNPWGDLRNIIGGFKHEIKGDASLDGEGSRELAVLEPPGEGRDMGCPSGGITSESPEADALFIMADRDTCFINGETAAAAVGVLVNGPPDPLEIDLLTAATSNGIHGDDCTTGGVEGADKLCRFNWAP